MYIKSKNLSLISQDNSVALSSRTQYREGVSRIAKKKDNNNEEADILVKACCPNCRYVFKIVNENKLSNVKKKIQKLQPILQQNSSIYDFKNIGNFNLSVSPPKQNNLNFEKKIQIMKEKQFDQKYNKLRIQIEQQSPKELLERKTKISPKHPKSDMLHDNPKDTTMLKNNKKSPQSKGSNIQSDIKKFKNLLTNSQLVPTKSKSKKQKKLKQNSLNNFLKGTEIFIQNYSQIQKADEMESIFNSVSSIEGKSKRRIQISKKQDGAYNEVQMLIAFSAAKSLILQNDTQLLSKYIDNSTYTPSYIKSLSNFYNQS